LGALIRTSATITSYPPIEPGSTGKKNVILPAADAEIAHGRSMRANTGKTEVVIVNNIIPSMIQIEIEVTSPLINREGVERRSLMPSINEL
jgi:hypothetical protein